MNMFNTEILKVTGRVWSELYSICEAYFMTIVLYINVGVVYKLIDRECTGRFVQALEKNASSLYKIPKTAIKVKVV